MAFRKKIKIEIEEEDQLQSQLQTDNSNNNYHQYNSPVQEKEIKQGKRKENHQNNYQANQCIYQYQDSQDSTDQVIQYQNFSNEMEDQENIIAELQNNQNYEKKGIVNLRLGQRDIDSETLRNKQKVIKNQDLPLQTTQVNKANQRNQISSTKKQQNNNSEATYIQAKMQEENEIQLQNQESENCFKSNKDQIQNYSNTPQFNKEIFLPLRQNLQKSQNQQKEIQNLVKQSGLSQDKNKIVPKISLINPMEINEEQYSELIENEFSDQDSKNPFFQTQLKQSSTQKFQNEQIASFQSFQIQKLKQEIKMLREQNLQFQRKIELNQRKINTVEELKCKQRRQKAKIQQCNLKIEKKENQNKKNEQETLRLVNDLAEIKKLLISMLPGDTDKFNRAPQCIENEIIKELYSLVFEVKNLSSKEQDSEESSFELRSFYKLENEIQMLNNEVLNQNQEMQEQMAKQEKEVQDLNQKLKTRQMKIYQLERNINMNNAQKSNHIKKPPSQKYQNQNYINTYTSSNDKNKSISEESDSLSNIKDKIVKNLQNGKIEEHISNQNNAKNEQKQEEAQMLEEIKQQNFKFQNYLDQRAEFLLQQMTTVNNQQKFNYQESKIPQSPENQQMFESKKYQSLLTSPTALKSYKTFNYEQKPPHRRQLSIDNEKKAWNFNYQQINSKEVNQTIDQVSDLEINAKIKYPYTFQVSPKLALQMINEDLKAQKQKYEFAHY